MSSLHRASDPGQGPPLIPLLKKAASGRKRKAGISEELNILKCIFSSLRPFRKM